MIQLLFGLIGWIYVFVINDTLYAQVKITPQTERIELGQFMKIGISNSTETLNSILENPLNTNITWTQSNQTVPNMGFSNNTHYFLLDIQC